MQRARITLLAAFAVLGAVVAAANLLLPRHVEVRREVSIDRPPCTVFALIDGFDRARDWSPWATDPDLSMFVSGPHRGPGAALTWESAAADGGGKLLVTQSRPCAEVELAAAIEGLGPADVRVALAPVEGKTQVTWTFRRDTGFNPIARVYGSNLEPWLGPIGERGLANLRTAAERLSRVDFAGLEVHDVDVAPVPLATASAAGSGLGEAVRTAFTQVSEAVSSAGMTVEGPRRATLERDGAGGWRVRVAVPVRGQAPAYLSDGPVRVEPGYGGPALRVGGSALATSAADQARLAAWAMAYGRAPATEPPWLELAAETGDGDGAPVAILMPVR